MYHSDEHHLQAILATLEERVSEKYHKGCAEHGGHLWEKSGLIDEALNEVVDLAVYLITLKEQISQVQAKFDSYAQEVSGQNKL